MKINRVGVDLAKNVFQLHGADRRGKTVWKRRLSRSNWIKILCETVKPGTEIGMEACAGAHHWGRQLMQRGPSGTEGCHSKFQLVARVPGATTRAPAGLTIGQTHAASPRVASRRKQRRWTWPGGREWTE